MRNGWVWLWMAACDPSSTSDVTPSRDDAPGDVTDDTDPSPVEAPVVVARVRVPLGETLFLDGDDYLARWGVGGGARVTVASAPDGATAAIRGAPWRLTPDRPGPWVLERDGERIEVEVDGDYLDADTFLNFNYSPVDPLLAWDEGTVWVASPPSNAVQALTVSDGGLVAGPMIDVGAWPTALARWGDLLLVSQTGRDSLGFVDPAAGRLVDAIEIGDEPAGIVVDGDSAWVALSGPGEVVKVDLLARRVARRIAVGREPKAVAFDAARRRLFVASQLSSNAHPMGTLQVLEVPEHAQRDVHVVDVDAERVVGTVNAVGTILRGLLVDGDRLLITASESHNDAEQVTAESHPHRHHLVVADLDTLEVTERVTLGWHPGATGPVPGPASMARLGDRVWVSASGSDELVALDAATWAERERVVVGADPRGLLVVDGDLLTFPWLDEVVARVRDGVVATAVGRDPTPADVRAGQKLFSDARFSRYGEFSCNSCHIDGVNDGLTWDLLLDGPVNTLPFRNIGGTGPFLWGGFLPTLFDFSREVLRLVGAEATGEQMELLNVYMQSVTSPPNPHALPGGRLTEAAERGRALFEGEAGCVSCHPAPLFTNQLVVPGKSQGLPTDVPSLIGAWDSGPWGRQGQWVTLEAMVEAATAYTGFLPTRAQRDDLVAYVRELPGDALYVTSVLPLEGSQHVWLESPVELAFSGLLAEGQEGLLSFEADTGGGWAPVAGAWQLSGRYARFAFDDGGLQQDTRYRIRVGEGLAGALGTRLGEALLLEFATGRPPTVDLSGGWLLVGDGLVEGALDIGFVQSRGGQVTGARTEGTGGIDFDHLQGFVDGDVFVAYGFHATIFGLEVVVDALEVTLVDHDGDGFADVGTGVLRSGQTELDVLMVRQSLPGP